MRGFEFQEQDPPRNTKPANADFVSSRGHDLDGDSVSPYPRKFRYFFKTGRLRKCTRIILAPNKNVGRSTEI